MLQGQMLKPGLLISLISLFVATLPALGANEPSREILGLSLKMTREEAQKRLQEIGTFERDERKQQQIWKVRDASLSHLIIAFNKEGQMRFITAVAREDKEASRVPYARVGDLKKAQQAGDEAIKNFHYQWDLPAGKDSPAVQVSARGRDPKFLTTWSVKRLSD